jgi:hypothetical protein
MYVKMGWGGKRLWPEPEEAFSLHTLSMNVMYTGIEYLCVCVYLYTVEPIITDNAGEF